MFFTMAALVMGNFSGMIAALADPAGAIPAETAGRAFAFQIFIMSRALILFGLFYVWAVLTRKTRRETHKRMMVLATFVVIDAGLGRMTWLPGASRGRKPGVRELLSDGGP
jgi:heme A synthase